MVELPPALAVMFGPQGLNAISSKAKSLPHPPAALFTIFSTTLFTFTGVENKNPNLFQTGVFNASIFPELNVWIMVPSIFSIEKVRFGLMPFPPQLVGFNIFITHAENSYVVFEQNKFTVSI